MKKISLNTFVLDEFIKIEERLKTKFDITNINLNKKKR